MRVELQKYLRYLANVCAEVIVLDGSPPEVFEANAAAWPFVLHVRPREDQSIAMGKVAGIRTGARAARHEDIVIGDDDVRYDLRNLQRVASLLERCDLVRPQNFFEPLPPHARWESARILLNRALGGDFPGTLAIKRSFLLDMSGYRGDVLFENLDLIRTVEAEGGRVCNAMDLYVKRVPPSFGRFLEQRVRHAYEDFAFPARMVCWLSILPLLALALRQRRRSAIGIGALASALLAERGRARRGGRGIFPATTVLFAPLWLLERGFCAWLALFHRLAFGGFRYHDRLLSKAAHSKRFLRRRLSPG